MNAREPIVFIVDDDEALCDSLSGLLESEGFRTRTFASAEAFLAEFDPTRPGCLVLDVRMQGMTGLELQARLADAGSRLPVIVITGHGDIPMAVRAVQGGAFDFLEKPVSDELLRDRIRAALALDADQRRQAASTSQVRERLGRLTGREREVLEMIIAGLANKQIALQLDITPRTVEVHRKHIMEKLGAGNAVTLVRMVLDAGLPARPADPPV